MLNIVSLKSQFVAIYQFEEDFKYQKTDNAYVTRKKTRRIYINALTTCLIAKIEGIYLKLQIIIDLLM